MRILLLLAAGDANAAFQLTFFIASLRRSLKDVEGAGGWRSGTREGLPDRHSRCKRH